MKNILGVKGLELTEFAIAANAMVGIRDSGKTYSATKAAEELYDAGVPFIALDPIGVWHSLRVPGAGKGYPVVVAGGKHGDLPLTVKSVGAIVRAAMKDNISLVLDLFSVELSKADWKRIVKETCEILLHENSAHGLRHIFIEEAGEFVPQMMRGADAQVFSAVEKVVRMGGNSKLGITLINQRSADLSKSVLELCANVFVHRQRGKNTLQDLKKWLSLTDPDTEKKITASLPDLSSGQCWVMSNDLKTPVLIKVPQKNSKHPDRRAATMTKAEAARSKPVPADDFVAAMKAALAEKAKPLSKPPSGVVFASLGVASAGAEKKRHEEMQAAEAFGFGLGYQQAIVDLRPDMENLQEAVTEAIASADVLNRMDKHLRLKLTDMQSKGPKPAARRGGASKEPSPAPHSPTKAPASPTDLHRFAKAAVEGLTRPQAKILQSLAWWAAMGHHNPTRVQVGIKAKMKARGGHFKTRVSELSGMGLVAYDGAERMLLTENGKAAAPAPDLGETVLASLRPLLSNPQTKILDALLAGNLDRQDIAAYAGMDAAGGHFKTRLSELSSFEIIDYPDKASAVLQDWVRG